MDSLAVGFVGLVVGMLCFLSVVRWAGLFLFAYLNLEVLHLPDRRARAMKLGLCQSVFHSGPWFVATMAYVGYHIRSEPWSSPFFIGFFAGVVYLGIFTARAIKAMRARPVVQPQ